MWFLFTNWRSNVPLSFDVIVTFCFATGRHRHTYCQNYYVHYDNLNCSVHEWSTISEAQLQQRRYIFPSEQDPSVYTWPVKWNFQLQQLISVSIGDCLGPILKGHGTLNMWLKVCVTKVLVEWTTSSQCQSLDLLTCHLIGPPWEGCAHFTSLCQRHKWQVPMFIFLNQDTNTKAV